MPDDVLDINIQFRHQLCDQLSGGSDRCLGKIPVLISCVHRASAFLFHAHLDADAVAVFADTVVLASTGRLPTAAAMPGIIVVIVIPLPDVSAMPDPKVCRSSDGSTAVIVGVGLCVAQRTDVMNDNKLNIILAPAAGCVVDLHEIFVNLDIHKNLHIAKKRAPKGSHNWSCSVPYLVPSSVLSTGSSADSASAAFRSRCVSHTGIGTPA